MADLCNVIPFNWRRPRLAATAIGRQVTLWETALAWAGSERNAGRSVRRMLDAINQDVADAFGRDAMFRTFRCNPARRPVLIQMPREPVRAAIGGSHGGTTSTAWPSRRPRSDPPTRGRRRRILQADVEKSPVQCPIVPGYSAEEHETALYGAFSLVSFRDLLGCLGVPVANRIAQDTSRKIAGTRRRALRISITPDTVLKTYIAF